MRSLKASIRPVAASSAPVVVTGETGVGKELVTGGNKEQATQILGVDLSTLYRWQRARQD
jgi:transcriptional regulator with PAS, ATPase and Fis domain